MDKNVKGKKKSSQAKDNIRSASFKKTNHVVGEKDKDNEAKKEDI